MNRFFNKENIEKSLDTFFETHEIPEEEKVRELILSLDDLNIQLAFEIIKITYPDLYLYTISMGQGIYEQIQKDGIWVYDPTKITTLLKNYLYE